jgi:hypothetical protein
MSTRGTGTSSLRRVLIAGCFLSGAIITPAVAPAETRSCAPGTVVIYVNGIDTSPLRATTDINELMWQVGRAYNDWRRPLTYRLVYNNDDGDLNDFREAILRWASQDLEASAPSSIIRPVIEASIELIYAAAMAGTLSALLEVLKIPVAIAEEIQQVVADEMVRLNASHSRANELGIYLRDTIESRIDAGNTVVVVAHSQGNFVANDAIGMLPNDKLPYVSRVSVASPASNSGASKGWDVKLQRDMINRVPGSVPWTIPQLPTNNCPDASFGIFYLNHSFFACYLNWSYARNVIVSVRSAVLDFMDHAPLSAFSGEIFGTMRSNLTSPEITFHTFEPSGVHVWRENLEGPTARYYHPRSWTGNSEEIVYICDSPAVGTYRFAVSHSEGWANRLPGTANVSLLAGTVQRQMPPVDVPEDAFVPIPTGSVIVTRDAQGRFSYRIE